MVTNGKQPQCHFVQIGELRTPPIKIDQITISLIVMVTVSNGYNHDISVDLSLNAFPISTTWLILTSQFSIKLMYKVNFLKLKQEIIKYIFSQPLPRQMV